MGAADQDDVTRYSANLNASGGAAGEARRLELQTLNPPWGTLTPALANAVCSTSDGRDQREGFVEERLRLRSNGPDTVEGRP